MVNFGCEICPNCGGKLKFYDVAPRRVLEYEREASYISVRRLVCTNCKRVHRELPEGVLPYKHYSADVIFKSRLEFIDDYPCELTLKRWASLKLQVL